MHALLLLASLCASASAGLTLDNDFDKNIDSNVGKLNEKCNTKKDKIKTYFEDKNEYVDNDLCEVLTDNDIPNEPVPETFDWRTFDVVSPVYGDTNCKNYAARAAAAFLESQYVIKYGKHILLSDQQITDCDAISDKCCGGKPSLAFKAVMKIGGVMLLRDYPRRAEPKLNYYCYSDPTYAAVRVTGCRSYNLTSQEKVKQLLYSTGPLVIGIGHRFSETEERMLDIMTDEQCVSGNDYSYALLVGYGTENNKPYWFVKTFFGHNFRQSGYIRMQRSNNVNGACGMLKTTLTTATIE